MGLERSFLQDWPLSTIKVNSRSGDDDHTIAQSEISEVGVADALNIDH